MRYHWGLGVGHLYSHEHHTASGLSSREVDTTVRLELSDLDNSKSDSDQGLDSQLSARLSSVSGKSCPDNCSATSESELDSNQLEQALQAAEGSTEKLEDEDEDEDEDRNSESSYPGSEAEHDDSEDDIDSSELFDMFGGTQALDLISYD